MPVESGEPVSSLDIRGVPCPINFVKTKLALEKIASGQVLEVLVSGDAVENIPKSAEDEGHAVVKDESLPDAHRLWIKKA